VLGGVADKLKASRIAGRRRCTRGAAQIPRTPTVLAIAP
jgi:hypothetical protein